MWNQRCDEVDVLPKPGQLPQTRLTFKYLLRFGIFAVEVCAKRYLRLVLVLLHLNCSWQTNINRYTFQ